jgi:hypothetical protein
MDEPKLKFNAPLGCHRLFWEQITRPTEQVSLKVFMAFLMGFALAFAAGLYFIEILAQHSGQ